MIYRQPSQQNISVGGHTDGWKSAQRQVIHQKLVFFPTLTIQGDETAQSKDGGCGHSPSFLGSSPSSTLLFVIVLAPGFGFLAIQESLRRDMTWDNWFAWQVVPQQMALGN